MSLRSRLRNLPRLLLVEASLTVVIVLTGVVPFVVFTRTPISAPLGFGRIYAVPVGALGALWVTLLYHAVVDAVRIARRHGAAEHEYELTDPSLLVHAGFRLLATLGALALPAVPGLLFGRGEAPLPPGSGVALAMALAVPLLGSGLIACVHLGWVAWTAPRPP